MSTQDYDQLEKVFNGSWKSERDENMEDFLAASGKKLTLILLNPDMPCLQTA